MKAKQLMVIFLITAMVIFIGCGDSGEGGTYAILITMVGNVPGDSVIATPNKSVAGTIITLEYMLKDSAPYNRIDFKGVFTPIEQIIDAGSGTREYTINPADASGGVITIIATFKHAEEPLLNPPYTVARLTGSDGIFVISNKSDNDPDVFLGYELYYKFYNFTDATATMASDDRSIFSVEQPTPTDITRLGFRRVNTVPDTDRTTRSPMIPISYGDRNSSFNVSLDFTNVSSLSAETAIPPIIPEVTYLSNPTVYLYRQVLDPDDDSSIKNNYKSFGDLTNNFGPRDADLPTGRVTLSLYIFACGKYEEVNNIYSNPLWLGYIDYADR